MPITLVNRYTLRNVPWENIFRKYVTEWHQSIARENPWTLEERTLRYLRSDGLQDQFQYEFSDTPLDFLGFDKSFSYKDDSSYNVRLMARRYPQGYIEVYLYTTLNLASSGQPAKPCFTPGHLLHEFAVDISEGKIHTGTTPESVYLRTSRSALWRMLSRPTTNSYVDVFAPNEIRRDDPPVFETNTTEYSAVEKSPVNYSSEENSPADYSVMEKSTADCSIMESSIGENSIPENSSKNYSSLEQKVRQLEEKLEESFCENDALSEQLEEYKRLYRELQNGRKSQNKVINEQKDKIERLKKRMKQADKRANMNADEKFTKFCEDFDKENDELRRECRIAEDKRDELQKKLQEAEGKVVSLKGRLAKASNGQSGGLLNVPSESEKFDDEFGVAIFSALHKAIEKTPSKSNSYGNRPIDMWKAIIQANPDLERAYQNYCTHKDQLMEAMKSNNLERNFHLLTPLGMTYSSHTNNHWKLNFIDGDRRYSATHASTPSETASGPSNSAKDLKNACLYPT